MQRPRESSVVTLLRGGSIPEISPAAFKKQRNAFIKWNQLAYYFPLLAIPAIIIGFIICRYAFNYLAGYIFAGSVLSLLSEFLIIGSYVQLKSWRKHPSRLLLYHSFTNAALAIVTILNALRAGGSDRDGARDDNPDSRWCMTLSFFTQLSFFAGECWLFVVSIDLVTSLSNPFSSLHGNLLKYKFFVWFASFISAVTLMTMHRCQGVTTDHMCWLHVEDLSSGCLWAFVIAWVTVYYVFSSAVLMYAFFRISRGLESTYATRLSCVKKHLNVLVAYIGYAILLLLLYIFYIVSEAEENDGNEIGDTDTPRFIEHILGMLLGCRGVVDGLLWFKLHRVPSSQGKRATSIGGRILSMVSASAFMNKNTSSRSAPLLPDGDPSCTVSDRADQSTVDDDRREKNVSRASGNLANRLWNGGSFISGDMDERESGVRASSFAIPQRFSTAGDKYRNSVGVLSQGTVSIVENTDDTGNDDDDDDLWVDFSLNPQLNMALRQEVLHFVTQGILQSLHRAASVETSFSSSEKSFHGEEKSLSGSVGDNRIRAMRAVTSSNSTRPTGDISVDHIPGSSVKEFVDQCKSISIETSVDSFSGTRKSDSKASPDEVTSAYDYTFKLDEKHYFRDRFPLLFRKLRSLVDISDEWYAHQISLPARERLAEGSSGAFMFFCGEGEFMVKTISFQESLALCSILERYITHLSNNPCSLLVRFLGLHELTMYRQTFYFVVMRNIFPPSATINLKYDIKGSWVNRSASGLMPPGTKSYCQHCGEPFRVGSSSKCPDRVGTHEPNHTLKDNDLTTKIRMKPEEAYEIIDAVHKDSDALCQMGITDYSLLVGVRNLSYDVDPEGMLYKRSKSFATEKDVESLCHTGELESNNVNAMSSKRENVTSVDTKDGLRDTIVDNHVVEGGMLDNPPNYNPPGLNPLKGGEVSDRSGKVVTIPMESEANTMQGGYAARAVIAPGVYFFGIVDILQTWSAEKKIEKLFKVYVLGKPASGISCMEPEPYKERFQKKISEVIEHSIFVRHVTGSWKGKREITGPKSLIPDT